MLYGWSTWKGHLDRWDQVLEQVKDSSFDYIELSLDYPLPEQVERLKDISKKVKDLGLRISFHAPWRGIDLASPWEPLRRGAVEVLKNVAEIGANLDGEFMVIHLTTSERLEGDIKEKIIVNAKRSVEDISRISSELGFNIFIENVGKLGHPDVLGEIIDHSELGICWDIAHAVADFARRHKVDLDKVDVDDVITMWTQSFENKIKCMHVHGVSKQDDKIRSHQGFGYPITRRVVAKAIALASPDYVTAEIYYNNGKEVGPRFVRKELEDVFSWLRVYRKR